MSNKELAKLNLAIQEQRYRDAREIIENGDLDWRTARKWRRWLSEYYREEWSQAGIENSKKPATSVSNHGLLMGNITVLLISGALFVLVSLFGLGIPVIGSFGIWGWVRIFSRFSLQSALMMVGVLLSLFICTLVATDSNNAYATFIAGLMFFAAFVAPGFYFLMQDYGLIVGLHLARQWRTLRRVNPRIQSIPVQENLIRLEDYETHQQSDHL